MHDYEWEIFISHASEDKDAVARPLASHLTALGIRVWLDESELRLGDSLRTKIDAGLARSRFGIVILSPSFFAKNWTKAELDGLIARESDGVKVVLPIWHNVDHDEVRIHSPILAGRLAVKTDRGVENVAKEILAAIGGRSAGHTLAETLSETVRSKINLLPADAIQSILRHLSFYDPPNSEHRAPGNSLAPNGHPDRGPSSSPPDFDIEVVRALVAAGRHPPDAWLPSITSLSFEDGKYRFDDLGGLSRLTWLERLDLYDIEAGSLDPLAGLKNLKWLYLSDSRSSDLSPLAGLEQLEHLDVNMTRVTDAQPLRHLRNLKHLNLFSKRLKDISALKELGGLKYLNLSMTQIEDITPLASLRSLQILVLMATPLREISPLTEMRDLKCLCLWKTSVDDIAPLASLTELRTLDIDETAVRSVAPLANLIQLKFLNARGTNIDDWSPLSRLTNLEVFLTNKRYNGPAKIDVNEEWQTWYWTRSFSIDEGDLRSLVATYGDSAVVIQRVLDDRWQG